MNCLYNVVAVTVSTFLEFEALLLFAPKIFHSFIPPVLICYNAEMNFRKELWLVFFPAGY